MTNALPLPMSASIPVSIPVSILVLRRAAACVLRLTAVLALAAAGSGCTTLNPYGNAAFNERLDVSAPPPEDPPRNTFAVNGNRGNKRVLMFLSMSGGGSRSAYLSASTMLALQEMKETLGADLLAEVDVMSSVSGGSLAAAYYAASRDNAITDAATLARLAPLLATTPPVQPKLQQATPGRLTCSGALTAEETVKLRDALAAPGSPADGVQQDLRQLVQLCLASTYPAWDRDTVLKAMKTDYLALWIGNWFWPRNIWRYWTSSFDRSDIMAQTLANNLYRRQGLLGDELKLSDLNPTRPYIVINATNASGQAIDANNQDDYPFGSVFTFTQEDFRERLASDANRYSLARAVMGSSSFPLVFASMTLQDFRKLPGPPRCAPAGTPDAEGCHDERYLHIFDGGNSDNLGLRSVKRTLLELQADNNRLEQYDRILVLMVDAFTLPRGAARDKPDPRSLISLLVDTNVSDAVDSLLQTNRAALLREFDDGQLGWSLECNDVESGLRQLPIALCNKLKALSSNRKQAVAQTNRGEQIVGLDLRDKLVFYHFAFEDVGARFTGLTPEGAKVVKARLDSIPTSFRIANGDADVIEQAVRLVINPANPCMQAMARLVQLQGPADRAQVAAARQSCKRSEGGRAVPAP